MIKNLESSERIRILENNYVGHLGYIWQQSPFVVPITFFYDGENKSIIGYSGDGHKIKAMRKNPTVSMAVEEVESVTKWRSVLIQGKFEEIKGGDAKYILHKFVEGVKDIITEKGKKRPSCLKEFTNKINSEVISVVYRIRIEDILGKVRDD
ncbi:MAG: pyridoxamine 5'-phosphate oxidase family protein [Gillisia sp.]